tara:strand:+ start:3068 stop:3457 length:390 start_codon:yes stop_codon:yes gene_type:complete
MVVDDRNQEQDTLGRRRLKSPHQLYPLKRMIESFTGLIKHKGKNYVDSNGKYFRYTKSIKGDLICHKIRKTESKDIGTVVYLEGIPSAFTEKRPLPKEMRYARVLYLGKNPFLVYDYCKNKRRKTWRKI